MSQSSPEGIILGKGSKLISFNAKINDEVVVSIEEKQDMNKYSEEEVEDLIYKVCGTVARLQGITLNGNHIDTAYKQFKNK